MQSIKSKLLFLSLLALPVQSYSSESYISHLLANPQFKAGACGHIYLSPQAKRKLAFLKAYQQYKGQQKELMRLFPLTANDLDIANLKLANVVKKTLENDGFQIGDIAKVKSQTEAGGQTVTSYDFYVPIVSPPEGSDFRKIFDRLKVTNPQLKFYYIVDAAGRANGAYSDYRTTIYLNPDHIYLDKGDITNTPLHEITHSHRYKLIEQGQSSLLNASIKSAGDTPVTSVPGYTNYMNFQELATFTKDYHLLKTGRVQNVNVLSGEVDPFSRKITLEEVTQLKKTRATTIARNIQQIILSQQEAWDTFPKLLTKKIRFESDKVEGGSTSYKTLISELDQLFTLQSDPFSANYWMIKFPYSNNGQNTGELQIWLPELKLTNSPQAETSSSGFTSLTTFKLRPSQLPNSDLQQVYELVHRQLNLIKKEAMDYEQSLTD